MRRNKRNAGFTMPELILTVGIIAALMAVVAINYVAHQRNILLMEYDNKAKEIFVAAQNHLSLAASQNLVEKKNYKGYESKLSGDEGVYYFAHPTDEFSNSVISGSVLDLMLPMGSIDESVRDDLGSYVIRYDPVTATVLDVFYTESEVPASNGSSGKVKALTVSTSNTTAFDTMIKSLLPYTKAEGEDNKEARKRFEGNDVILGHYGGANMPKLNKVIEAPIVKVVNGDKLLVRVFNPVGNDDLALISSDGEIKTKAQLKLMVQGLSSKAMATIKVVYKDDGLSGPETEWAEAFTETDFDALKAEGYDVDPADECVKIKNTKGEKNKYRPYTIVLDDITTVGGHFADLDATETGAKKDYVSMSSRAREPDKKTLDFKPGENIKIWAQAFTTEAAANIASSSLHRTNSLFASIRKEETSTDTDPVYIARIKNFRHLENLNGDLSDIGINVSAVEQTADLDWNRFLKKVSGKDKVSDAEVYIYKHGGTTTTQENDKFSTTKNIYAPVKPSESFIYSGGFHKIANVRTEVAGNAGLFGELKDNSRVENLELRGFKITSTGTGDQDEDNIVGAGTLTGKTGKNVLIDSVLACDGISIEKAISSRVVSGGTAGGLVGQLGEGSTVRKCGASVKQVTAGGAGNAGGLVGSAVGSDENATTIEFCYASGHTTNAKYIIDDLDTEVNEGISAANVRATSGSAGGLVGDNKGATIKCCYATGSVSGSGSASKVGGLVGSSEAGSVTMSYATGYVVKPVGSANFGSFVGSYSGTAFSDDSIYGLVNANNGVEVPVVGNAAANDDFSEKIVDFTLNKAVFEKYAPYTSNALPNDTTLLNLYSGKYEFLTIKGLADLHGESLNKDNGTSEAESEAESGEEGTAADNVVVHEKAYWIASHRGDWQSAEAVVVNTKKPADAEG